MFVSKAPTIPSTVIYFDLLGTKLNCKSLSYVVGLRCYKLFQNTFIVWHFFDMNDRLWAMFIA